MWNKGGQESGRQWSPSEIGISCPSSGSASKKVRFLRVPVPARLHNIGYDKSSIPISNIWEEEMCTVLYLFEICQLTQNSVWFPAQDSERHLCLCVDPWYGISIFFFLCLGSYRGANDRYLSLSVIDACSGNTVYFIRTGFKYSSFEVSTHALVSLIEIFSLILR